MIARSQREEFDFFVSYAAPDRAWAQWLDWQLQAAGYDVGIQLRDIPPGANFPAEMHRLAQGAAHTVALLSRDYLVSEYATAEWLAAFRTDPLGERRKLITVRVGDCQPGGLLGSISYCDLVGLPEEPARQLLLASMRVRRPSGPSRVPDVQCPPFPSRSGSEDTDVAPLPVYGLDGEPHTRPAANHVRTEVDVALERDIAEHMGLRVVLVLAAPGEGKSWTLAQAAVQAETTHLICRVDVEQAAARGCDARDAVVEGLRTSHQRCYGEIERVLLANRRPRDAPEIDPGLLSSLLVDELASSALPIANARARLDELAARLARLPAPEVLRRGRALDSPGVAYLRERMPRLDEDDLADELLLLLVLADARCLLSAATDGDLACPPPRKLLVLIDSPDRAANADVLLSMLRGLQSIAAHEPALTRVLVVVAKTERSRSRAVHSSALRPWHRARPFTRSESAQLVAAIQDAGWLPAEWSADVLLDHCETLGTGNRRVTCLYLDYCRRVGELGSITGFLDGGSRGELRLTGVISTWAAHAVHALAGVERDIAGHVAVWLEQVCHASDVAGVTPAAIQAPAQEPVTTFAQDMGLLNGVWVGIVQQATCRQILGERPWRLLGEGAT